MGCIGWGFMTGGMLALMAGLKTNNWSGIGIGIAAVLLGASCLALHYDHGAPFLPGITPALPTESRIREYRTFSGVKGIVKAAGLANDHNTGRQTWQAGTVTLTDADMTDFSVVIQAEYLLNYPSPLIQVVNRLSGSPKAVHKRLFDEQHKSFRRT